jgi:putative pyrroloquinoline-quinone binding quinoprotein/putative pyrroloquinoline-quinone-binding quinoprotein
VKTRSLLMLGALLITLAPVSGQQNWPQFRGEHAGVVPDNPSLPDTWSATENVVWKTTVPGIGWGSAVVWGDHVFVTAGINTGAPEPFKSGQLRAGDVIKPAAPYRWVVYDVSLETGSIRWMREVATAVPADGTHMKNSYASETPVTDGERVYAYFANLGVFVFDMSGRPVWSNPMGPFRFRNGWGSAASPVLHEDRLFIVNDNDTQSFIAAYDKRTGRELWKRDREIGTNWATPFVWTNTVRTELIVPGSVKTRSYDMEGQVLWELTGMSTIDIPTPFAAHGLLFINSGYVADSLRPVYAIRPGATGDVSLKTGETSNAYIVWSHPTLGSYNPSSLVYGDYYYTLHDRGFFTANDAKTGKEIYGRQRITNDVSGFSASPWAYNGRIFALSEDGDTFVIAAGPEFKVVGRNSLDERTLATPAVVGDSLIIRSAGHLFRIARRGR